MEPDPALHPAHQAVMLIACYNHAPALGRVIEAARPLGWPIIVVDDGSTDQTRQVAERAGVITLSHSTNLGKGAALKTGLAYAAGLARHAITLDADGQHDPREAPSLLEAALKSPVPALVIGARRGMEKAPWTSRQGLFFSNFFTWLATGRWITDTQSGFRAYPLPQALGFKARGQRFDYELAVLAQAAWRGLDILEVPVSVAYAPPGGRVSHFRPLGDTLLNLKTHLTLPLGRLATRRARKSRKNI